MATATRGKRDKKQLTTGEVFGRTDEGARAEYERWVLSLAKDEGPTIEQAGELREIMRTLNLDDDQLQQDVETVKSILFHDATMEKRGVTYEMLDERTAEATKNLKQAEKQLLEAKRAWGKACGDREGFGMSQGANNGRKMRFRHIFPEAR